MNRGRRPDPAVREYFEVAGPLPGHVSVSRTVLEMLRGELATVWLDAVPIAEGWPPDLEPQASLARARGQGDSGVLRPGTGPSTVVLDPRQDDDFALITALTPFSRKVEAMSRQGQLVYASAPGSLRLRLTPQERAEFGRRHPDPAGRLTRTAPSRTATPNRTLERRSHGWRLAVWSAVLFGGGPLLLATAAGELDRPFQVMDVVWFLGRTVIIVVVMVDAGRVVRTAYRRRGRR